MADGVAAAGFGEAVTTGSLSSGAGLAGAEGGESAGVDDRASGDGARLAGVAGDGPEAAGWSPYENEKSEKFDSACLGEAGATDVTDGGVVEGVLGVAGVMVATGGAGEGTLVADGVGASCEMCESRDSAFKSAAAAAAAARPF